MANCLGVFWKSHHFFTNLAVGGERGGMVWRSSTGLHSETWLLLLMKAIHFLSSSLTVVSMSFVALVSAGTMNGKWFFCKYLELFDETFCLKVRQGTNILQIYC